MMGISKKLLLLMAIAIVADLTEGYGKCKNTAGKKYCKKRKDWCFKAELQPLMLAGCRQQCGLCDAPECVSGQIIGKDNQCVDLDCPVGCQKKIDVLTEQLSKVENDVEDLKNENSLLADRIKVLEDKVIKKEKKYTFFSTQVHMQTAKANCASLSGRAIAEVTTPEEHQMLRSLMVTQGSCSAGYWVGAENTGNGDWKWATSHQPVPSYVWGPGELDAATAKCAVYRNYFGSGYMINDLACENSRCYVCQQLV